MDVSRSTVDTALAAAFHVLVIGLLAFGYYMWFFRANREAAMTAAVVGVVLVSARLVWMTAKRSHKGGDTT